jgi:hypothetical protein
MTTKAATMQTTIRWTLYAAALFTAAVTGNALAHQSGTCAGFAIMALLLTGLAAAI